jgi:hypothetical protein
VCVVLRESRRVGEKSSAWVLGMLWGERGSWKSNNGGGRTRKVGSGLIGARKGQGLCPDKGSVHTPSFPTGESCEGGFLQTFREQVRGFDDLLRQKPSSVL